MRSIPTTFYKNKQWLNCRNAYFDYRHGLCERCLADGQIIAGVIVHHKEHLTPDNYTDSEIAYGFDNLELLCKECHNKEHFGMNDGHRAKIDELGNIIW